MRLWLMAGDQLFTGHTDLDPHPISVARAMPRMRQLDGNAARDNVGAVLLEPLGSLAHLGLYGVRAVDVMKNYLQWDFHGRLAYLRYAPCATLISSPPSIVNDWPVT